MIEVGIRELKSHLSHYVHLVQTGETIAIKVRRHVVGFFSKTSSQFSKEKPHRKSKRDMAALIKKWEKEGFIISGGPYRHRKFTPVRLTSGPTTTEMLRQMRDED